MTYGPRFGRRRRSPMIVGSTVIVLLVVVILAALFLTRKKPSTPSVPDAVVVFVSGVSGDPQRTDFTRILNYAQNAGDVLVVVSARHPDVAQSVPLAGAGINDLERQQSQNRARQTAIRLYETAASPGGEADFERSFETADDILHTIHYMHVWAAALGPVTNVAQGVSLNDPLTRGDPEFSISQVQGGISSCSNWRLAVAEETAQSSSLAEEQDREYWRRLMRFCGGRLTAWTINVSNFPSAEEVPSWNGIVHCGVTFELEGSTLFNTGDYQLLPEANRTLYSILERVNTSSQPRLAIDGYTDSQGLASYNQTLSQRRAEAVEDWFLAKGVNPSRVTAKGHGESDPVASNNTEEGRQLNRRVEVTLEYSNCASG